MVKVRIVNKATGIGKESGKAWARLTLAADGKDGRVIKDYFVSPEVWSKVNAIPMDSLVYVTADIDEKLHFSISDVRLVDVK